MNSSKKLDKNGIWLIVMTALPVVILTTLTSDLSNNFWQKVLFGGILGGLGSLFGFTLWFLTRHRSTLIKVFLLIGILCASLVPVYLVNRQSSDSQTLEKVWLILINHENVPFIPTYSSLYFAENTHGSYGYHCVFHLV